MNGGIRLFVGWVVFHVVVAVLLVLVVLLQSSKGEGLAGSAFGGGGGGGNISGAIFGGRGAASFLSRATTVLAVLFMFNCGALALMSSNRKQGVDPSDITTSAVTQQAQAQRDLELRAQQQQQLQQQQADTSGAPDVNIRVLPNEAADDQPNEAASQKATQPADSGGQ